jgi:hypothetical protein
MTLFEAELIFENWREAPPAHHLLQILARLGGWRPPRAPDEAQAADARALLAIPGIVQKPVGEGLPTAVLDFEALKRSYRR